MGNPEPSLEPEQLPSGVWFEVHAEPVDVVTSAAQLAAGLKEFYADIVRASDGGIAVTDAGCLVVRGDIQNKAAVTNLLHGLGFETYESELNLPH